ncbi:MAG: hypothetical protein Ct9H90mP5_03930 [Acidimicrobiaceae bacterium]|nr:MAG: hypothetical protein Ct9H90mP5_03930 [Acidimicrobiaceae bacterium]
MAQNYIEDPEPFINAVKEDRGDISPGEIALAISTDQPSGFQPFVWLKREQPWWRDMDVRV